MKDIHDQIHQLVERAKAARVSAITLACPATVAGDELAQDLAELARDFLGVSTALRQAAREQADTEAAARPKWAPPRMNAKRAADAIVKAGGYRVPA